MPMVNSIFDVPLSTVVAAACRSATGVASSETFSPPEPPHATANPISSPTPPTNQRFDALTALPPQVMRAEKVTSRLLSSRRGRRPPSRRRDDTESDEHQAAPLP